MNNYPRLMNRILVFAMMLLAAAIAVALGCSGGDDHPAAPQADPVTEHVSRSMTLGQYRIVLDEENWRLGIEPISDRFAEWDVTDYADFSIQNAEWDPASRNWTITVQLKNPTNLTGFGIWAVFTELGSKTIVAPDGFIYTAPPESKRVPVAAFGKNQLHREFPPYYQDVRDIIIHWPEEVHTWIPIEFYIDAQWPKARKMPVIEDLAVSLQSGLSGIYTITAYVEDWQDTGDTLTVWADCTTFGGGLPLMFDDGEHDDGIADDHTFGGFFIDNAVEPANYTITVYAKDPEDHGFENDITHFFSGGASGECFDFVTLAEGYHGQVGEFQELVIDDLDAMEDYWTANFGSTSGMPVVDFDIERVIAINLGLKSSSGFSIEIDRMCVDPLIDMLAIDVDYIRRHPGVGCIVMPAFTSPYWIGKIQKTEHTIFFFGMDYVYQCPDNIGSLNSWPVMRGYNSKLVNSGEYYIDNLTDWESFWLDLTGSSSGIPDIDFGANSIVAIIMGAKDRGMHFTDLRRILFDTEGTSNVYKARYAFVTPPEECYSCYIPTVPYGIWRMPKPDYPLEFDRYDQVMTCD